MALLKAAMDAANKEHDPQDEEAKVGSSGYRMLNIPANLMCGDGCTSQPTNLVNHQPRGQFVCATLGRREENVSRSAPTPTKQYKHYYL